MADIDLTTTASVPSGTAVTITVYEDTDGDGSAETVASQAIGDGTNTYTLSGFAGSGSYWIEAEFDHNEVTKTAELDKVVLGGAGGGDDIAVFEELAHDKLALIQKIRRIADDQPEQISSSEQTAQVPADGGDTVVGFLSNSAASIDTSGESLVKGFAEEADSVDETVLEQYTEAVRRLTAAERITKTAAIQGIPVCRESGQMLVTGLVAGLTLGVSPALTRFTRISRQAANVIDWLVSTFFNEHVQNIMDGIARTIDRTILLLLGPLSSSPVLEEIAEGLGEDFEDRLSDDRLEHLGRSAFDGLFNEVAGSAGNLDLTTFVDFGESEQVVPELTGRGLSAVDAMATAAKESDGGAFTIIDDIMEYWGEKAGKWYYEEYMFSGLTPGGLNPSLDSMVEELRERVDEEEILQIDEDTLSEKRDEARGAIQRDSFIALTAYEKVRLVSDALALIELILLLVAALLAVGAIGSSETVIGSILLGLGAGGVFFLATRVGRIFALLNTAHGGPIGWAILYQLFSTHHQSGHEIVRAGGA